MLATILDLDTYRFLMWFIIAFCFVVGIYAMSAVDRKFLRVTLAILLLLFGIACFRYQSQLYKCKTTQTTCYFMGNAITPDGGLVSL